jgi:hypothetical protein
MEDRTADIGVDFDACYLPGFSFELSAEKQAMAFGGDSNN